MHLLLQHKINTHLFLFEWKIDKSDDVFSLKINFDVIRFGVIFHQQDFIMKFRNIFVKQTNNMFENLVKKIGAL